MPLLTNKNALIFFLFKESRHVKRTAIKAKTMFFFKNRPRYYLAIHALKF